MLVLTSVYTRVANTLAYGVGLFALALLRKCLYLPYMKQKNVTLNFCFGRNRPRPHSRGF